MTILDRVARWHHRRLVRRQRVDVAARLGVRDLFPRTPREGLHVARAMRPGCPHFLVDVDVDAASWCTAPDHLPVHPGLLCTFCGGVVDTVAPDRTAVTS